MNEKRISIAMATYNGEKYLKEQLDSILLNMFDNDELVISDDGSDDTTIQTIKEYVARDSRIKFLNGPKMGIKQNFANAIKHSSGKYIFLSDQDDVWDRNKVEKVLDVFMTSKSTCVLHNAEIVDENLLSWERTFFEFRKSQLGYFRNILKNSYIGCCMAFSSSLKDIILPIPDTIEMHDQWIGLISEKLGKNVLMNDCLIKYRRHKKNFSEMTHHSVRKMLYNRYKLILELNNRLRNMV